MNDELEPLYYDRNGVPIVEFSLIKIFHFQGVNRLGRGRKNYYMYKWVRLREVSGKHRWYAHDLMSDRDRSFSLAILKIDKLGDSRVCDCEVVQSPRLDRVETVVPDYKISVGKKYE